MRLGYDVIQYITGFVSSTIFCDVGRVPESNCVTPFVQLSARPSGPALRETKIAALACISMYQSCISWYRTWAKNVGHVVTYQ